MSQIIYGYECEHVDEHALRLTFNTGSNDDSISEYTICNKCYDLPGFSDSENILSKELIK